MNTLHRVQELPISIEQAWEFFSSPKNLKHITPPYMGFDILSKNIDHMEEGQRIEYLIRPLFNFSMKWVSKISKVKPMDMFVDEQLKGPYKMWHHSHYFEPIPGGVRMTDLVKYQLPFGIFGKLFHGLVKKKLEDIFDYRILALKSKFGTLEH